MAHRRTRHEISFKQLVVVTREQRDVGPTTDELAWKTRIEHRTQALGFHWPKAGAVYAAMEAVKFVDRKLRPRRTHGPLGFTPVASLLPRPTGNCCGSSKPVSGCSPLICNRPAGHEGDHALANAIGEFIVRWV